MTSTHTIYNCWTLWLCPWYFVHPRGKIALEAMPRVPFSPPRVYKTHGPKSQRSTIVLLYLCIIVIPLASRSSVVNFKHVTLLRQTIHCLISRRTRNNSLEPAVVSYTALEIDQRWERSRWCTPVYITFHVTWHVEPCYMCFCCASHDWFSTNLDQSNFTVCYWGITTSFVIPW